MKTWKQRAIVVIAAITVVFTACDNGNNDNDDNAGTPGLYFALINGDTEYSVDRGTATSGAVVIPASYEGKPVTVIADHAFNDCGGLTNITIPATVTSIGYWVFYEWTNQQTIYIKGDSAGWNTDWDTDCEAVIKYWNGSSYE
jgi:hypothetical protein